MTAQTQIAAKYGQPDKVYFDKYCSLWNIEDEFPWFPVKRIYINNDFRDKWRPTLKQLEDANLHHEIITFDGCYVERKVRGSSKISLHSWAMAWDLNAFKEKLGQIETNWSPEFIAIIIANGIFWGDNFKNRKDPMHFSLYNG